MDASDPRVAVLVEWARGMAANYFYEDAYGRVCIRGIERQHAFQCGVQRMVDRRRAAAALNGVRVA